MRDDRSEIVGGGKPPALEHMTEAEAVRFGVALCDALLKNRPARGWHGALHPANLSYTTDGRVLLGPPLELIASFSPDEVEYLAPELFWNGEGGPATDVYAVGLLLYAACSGGRPPFTGEGALDAEKRAAAAASRMKGEEIRAPKGAGDELARVILRATAYREEERWPDIASLRGALEDCSVYAAPQRSAGSGSAKDGALPDAPPPRAVEPGMKNADVVVPVPAAPKPAEKPKPQKSAEKKPEPEKPAEAPAAEKKSETPPKKHSESAPKKRSDRPSEKTVSADDVVRGASRAAEAAAAPARRSAEQSGRAKKRAEEPIPEGYPRPVYDVFNEGKKKKRRSPLPAILTILALAVLFLVALYYWKEKDRMPEITPTPSPTPEVTEPAGPTPTPTPWRPSDPSPSPDPDATPDPEQSPDPNEETAAFAVTRLQIGSASRDEAATLCANEGGHLPVVNSQEDFDALVAEADKQGLSYVWLDAKRGADGVWRTSDGEEVAFFKWFRGEPSGYDTDGTAENCLMLWKYNGVWGYNDMRNDPGTAYYKYYGGRIAVYCQK